MSACVYFILGEFGGDSFRLKIGFSSDPQRRCCELQKQCPGQIWVQAVIPCVTRDAALSLERRLHERFSHLRVFGEWFIDSRQIWDHVAPMIPSTAREALA